MLSTSIFSANGSIYDQSAVFGRQFQLNQTALEEVGLPALTGSNVWKSLASNLAVCPGLSGFPTFLWFLSGIHFQIGGLIAHVILFWGPYAVDSFKLAYNRNQPDVHYQVNLITTTSWKFPVGDIRNEGNEEIRGSTMVVVCNSPCSVILCRCVYMTRPIRS